MTLKDINIRDPFVLREGGIYYMYGTRGRNFGIQTAGFDVYTSEDLVTWSEPRVCFDSDKAGLNRGSNWAPEVHKYCGAYYMFATFLQENGLRGTYVLKADSPLGPFEKYSDGAVTPDGWECLDGTLYVEDGVPYLVFCHEHTQIINGTVCYIPLTPDLSAQAGEPVFLFSGSDPFYIEPKPEGEHYVTDGPFMFRSKSGKLFMIWSTSVNGKYAECLVRFDSGSIKGALTHLDPIITSDGGHGMFFESADGLMITYHSPNTTGLERPVFKKAEDTGDRVIIV